MDCADTVKIAEDLQVNSSKVWNAYFEKRWQFLYSDQSLSGIVSDVFHDATGDHVYVNVELLDAEADESYEIIVRLPEGEIVSAQIDTDAAGFNPALLNTNAVNEAMQRIMLDTPVILEMARRAEEPDCSEDDLNALRDKIGGKIVRRMLVQCPYCQEYLFDFTHYTVEIPIKFYADCSEFYLYEEEMYQSVTEAVQAGKVTGECEHCGHILTAEDINAAKDGWKYRWRYDPHM